jgi:hypothetical protein
VQARGVGPLRVRLGHSAMSAQCPVCPEADIAERRAAPRSVSQPRDPARHLPRRTPANWQRGRHGRGNRRDAQPRLCHSRNGATEAQRCWAIRARVPNNNHRRRKCRGPSATFGSGAGFGSGSGSSSRSPAARRSCLLGGGGRIIMTRLDPACAVGRPLVLFLGNRKPRGRFETPRPVVGGFSCRSYGRFA